MWPLPLPHLYIIRHALLPKYTWNYYSSCSSISTIFMYEGVMRGSCYLKVERGPENISSVFYVKGTAIWLCKLSDHHLVKLNMSLLHHFLYDHLFTYWLLHRTIQHYCDWKIWYGFWSPLNCSKYVLVTSIIMMNRINQSCIVIERYGPAGLIFSPFTFLILICFHVGSWYYCLHAHTHHTPRMLLIQFLHTPSLSSSCRCGSC